MSLVRLLGFTTLACGCVIGKYREVATSREIAYVEEKGQSCGSHYHRRNHTVATDRRVQGPGVCLGGPSLVIESSSGVCNSCHTPTQSARDTPADSFPPASAAMTRPPYFLLAISADGSGLIEYSFRNTRLVLARFTLISRRRFFLSGSGFFE